MRMDLVVHPKRLLQFKLECVFVFIYEKPKKDILTIITDFWRFQMNIGKGRFDLALRVTNSSNSSRPDLLKSD